MKRMFLSLTLAVTVAGAGFPQEATLEDYDARAAMLQSVGMLSLASWAVGNGVANAAALFLREDAETRAFATMNLGWAGINLGLATLGYLTARRPAPIGAEDDGPAIDAEAYTTRLRLQQSWEQVFLFNAGLDVGYIFAGLWMRELADRTDQSDRLRGFGNAIILQGAGLFVFDLVLYLLHRDNGRMLLEALEEEAQ